jgi:DNA-binding MarR family transcriptional regulator
VGAALATTLLLCLALSAPGAASPDGSGLATDAGNGTDAPGVPAPLGGSAPTGGNGSLDAVDRPPVRPVSNASLGSALPGVNNDSLASRLDTAPLTAPEESAPFASRNRTSEPDPFPDRNESRYAADDGPFTRDDSDDRDAATDTDRDRSTSEDSTDQDPVDRNRDDRVVRLLDGVDPRRLVSDGPLSTVVTVATGEDGPATSRPGATDGTLRGGILSGATDATGGQSATALLALVTSDGSVGDLGMPMGLPDVEGPASAFALSDEPTGSHSERLETTADGATAGGAGGGETEGASEAGDGADSETGTQAPPGDRTDRTDDGPAQRPSGDEPVGDDDADPGAPATRERTRMLGTVAVPAGLPAVPVPTEDLPSGAGAGAGAAVGVAGAAAVVARQSGALSGTVEGVAATARTAAGSVSGSGRLERVVRLVAPLRYSRYDDSDPLEHDSRAAIHEIVEESPGTHLTAIAERTELPLSTVRHHVRILEREDLLSEGRQNGKRRFYPAYAENRAVTAALNDEATGPIVEALARLGSASVSDLARELDRTPSTITHHVQRLEEDGVVTRERDGRSVANRLSPEARAVVEAEAPARGSDGAEPALSD